MFGLKKTNKLIEDIDRYFDLIDESLLVFKDGVRNFLYSDQSAFNDKLKQMSSLDSEIEVLRRSIENDLYSQTALERSRADIMRLFEKTRNITDILNDSLFQFEIETPFIPSELNSEFLKLTEFATLAVEAVVPASKAYFRSPQTVPDKISRTYYYEKEAVKYSQTIKRTVFHKMTALKLSEKFHLRYFALHIENLSKAASNVADQLAVMAIRRTM
ncbi:MAG: hypothetical protein SPH70_07985 [Candidatus Cryptobacteroides sp.]|nr:hypothetical protein [Bacteroidales bacterium]MDY6158998.1 hypothetical protein [Candidatus Cryptobacteroides sp.]